MPQAKPSRAKRAVKFVVTVGILCALGFGGWHVYQKRAEKADTEKHTTVVTINKGDIEEVVTAQGKLEPKEYVDVGVQVSGQIKKLYVDLGNVVKKGDPIADIDPKVYESKVEADKAKIKMLAAQIAQQEAQLMLNTQQYDRNKKLLETNAVSHDAFDSADAQLKIAKAQKEALDAELEEAQSTLDGDQANLGYTKIFAPMDGTVVLADVKEGQTVNATQSAPRIVQLADLDTMTVRAQVAEADIMRLKEGGEVYFTTLGGQGRKWQGKIRQILPTPDKVNEVVLYNVLVDAENKDRQLMSGMSTQMFFVMGRANGVPLVPVAALGKRVAREDNASGMAYRVRIPGEAEGGKKHNEKVIHVGLMDRTMAEVKEGLNEGDSVTYETNEKPADPMSGVPKRYRNMGGRL